MAVSNLGVERIGWIPPTDGTGGTKESGGEQHSREAISLLSPQHEQFHKFTNHEPK